MWTEVSTRRPCEICGKADWCSRSADERTYLCRRVDAGGHHRIDQSGVDYWLYRESGEARPPAGELSIPHDLGIPRGNLKQVDAVYRAMLSELTLSARHRTQLGHRGLAAAAIERSGYRTLTLDGRSKLIGRLRSQFDGKILRSTPGIYFDARRTSWRLAGPPGLLIPVRDLKGYILALKIRRDGSGRGSGSSPDPKYLWLSSKRRGGPGPGNPPHVPVWEGKTDVIRLTEGELKSDVSTDIGNILTISVPGVSSWRTALPALLALQPAQVRLAFDADATENPNVARALRAAWAELSTRRSPVATTFDMVLERWPSSAGNGLDDVLAGGSSDSIEQLTAGAAEAYLAGLAEDPAADQDNSIRRSFRLTDLGNAERMVDQHGEDLLHCGTWSKLLVWTGRQWQTDDSEEAMRRAKQTVRSLYGEAEGATDDDRRKLLLKHAVRSETASKLQAMVMLSRSERAIQVKPAQMDSDPWVLNVANGLVDLRSGALLPHRRQARCTRLVPIAYQPDATCPYWLQFLDRVLMHDPEQIKFIQRAVGYTLTGLIDERCLFMLWGTGRNGKSTFLQALANLCGEYGMRTPTETLLVARGERIPNDIARLKGARYVFASEVEEGRRLAESMIKDVTGGDTISARFMRGEWFDYQPQFKIWLGTNHKPVILGTDEAIWDRIRLIPFTVRIPESELIPRREMERRLTAESPGMLAWAVRGCLAWQAEGLIAPPAVKSATHDYRSQMDELAAFFDEICVVAENAHVSSHNLYTQYAEWAASTGTKKLSQSQLGQRLAERGFECTRRVINGRRSRCWEGIGLADTQYGVTAPDQEIVQVTQFVHDLCDIDPGQAVASPSLYEAYTTWCSSNNKNALSKLKIGAVLQDMGYNPIKRGEDAIYYWEGINLKKECVEYTGTDTGHKAVRTGLNDVFDEGEQDLPF